MPIGVRVFKPPEGVGLGSKLMGLNSPMQGLGFRV